MNFLLINSFTHLHRNGINHWLEDLKWLLLAFISLSLNLWDNPIDSNPKHIHTLFRFIVQSLTTIVTVFMLIFFVSSLLEGGKEWDIPNKKWMRIKYVHGRKNLISELRHRQTEKVMIMMKITVKVLRMGANNFLQIVAVELREWWWCIFTRKESSYSIGMFWYEKIWCRSLSPVITRCTQ